MKKYLSLLSGAVVMTASLVFSLPLSAVAGSHKDHKMQAIKKHEVMEHAKEYRKYRREIEKRNKAMKEYQAEKQIERRQKMLTEMQERKKLKDVEKFRRKQGEIHKQMREKHRKMREKIKKRQHEKEDD